MSARCQPGSTASEDAGSSGSFFYHSNPRFGGDAGLRDERQLLVEEQKLCRARARRFSLETNRRRKALEERQKQWAVQEQRLRESILQQRRTRAQDATERFQRAHLPPSQRRRQSLRRNVPNIEDALSQLQGSLSSYTQQSSFLSSNIIRSCTPSPKPPTVSKSSNRQSFSAVEAYTKLLQEQSMTCLKNSQETEKTQERQQDHNPKDSHLADCCISESLSSKDSLENEDPNHSKKNLQCPYSSFLLGSEKPSLNMRKQNDLFPTSELTLSAVLLLGDNFSPSQKLNEPKQRRQEDSEWPNNKMHTSKASWRYKSEQTPETEMQPALRNCNLLTYCKIISAEPEHCGVNSQCSQNSPSDEIIVTNTATPDTKALESPCAKQEALLDLKPKRVLDDRQLKHPSATEILLPAKNGNSRDILFGAPPKPNIFLNDSTTDNASQEGALQQTGKDNHYLSSQKEPSASINNLNKVSNSHPKNEKLINSALLQHTCLSNIQSDKLKCLKCPEEEVQSLPVSVGTAHSVCEVRFIKGILKKKSKYISKDATYVYDSGHLIFAKQLALAIRDSVELTRAKAKDVENNNSIKKKLRWFDEVHVEKEDEEQNIMNQMKGKSSNLSQSKKDPEDHQLSLTRVSGASKPAPSMTPAASAGYHFTKQAWADVGVQVSLSHERADEVKVPRSSTSTAGPKVPWRERSARVGAGPVSSRTRKGTLIRPQSATEVSQIAKTQGRFMVPHPPPRIELVEEKTPYNPKTPYVTDHTGVNCKQALAEEQALHKDNSDRFFAPYTHHLIRTDSNVMYTPLPPSYTCPVLEGNWKGMPSSDPHETQGCGTRKRVVFNEKGLCLDCTPTDEEISQLWHGVRSALATEDAKTMLRRQNLESGKAVRKPCVEQSRQRPGSGNRRLSHHSQPTKKSTHPVKMFSNTYNVAFTEEGLERAAQLHLAEVHTEGLRKEKNIVASMETAQTQSPGTVRECSQQQALTSLSLEEQKILLSLDRLNHQLHCVREHVRSNTGTRGLVLINVPSTKEMKVPNHHRHHARASSVNNHSRYLKKF